MFRLNCHLQGADTKLLKLTAIKYSTILPHVKCLFLFCLFSWSYNPLCLYFRSPVAGFSLFVFEVS